MFECGADPTSVFALVLPLATRNDCGISRREVRVAIGLFWVFMASGMSVPAQARTIDAASEITAVSVLSSLAVKGRAPKTGYTRAQFGQTWADVDRNECDTRNDMLKRDLINIAIKAKTRDCVVLSGILLDRYSGETINFVRGKVENLIIFRKNKIRLEDVCLIVPSNFCLSLLHYQLGSCGYLGGL
jgi:hypothetical protein